MTFYAVLQSTETVIWDVGSRNRTRLNSRVLSWGGRFPLAAGDLLRFGAVDAVLEKSHSDDILVPDSQPQDGRKSSTRVAADVSSMGWKLICECGNVKSIRVKIDSDLN